MSSDEEVKIPQERDRLSHTTYEHVNVKKYVCFKFSNREYSIDIECVQEITEINYIRKVIYTPNFVLGVINLRGSIIAVVDLKQLFHIGEVDIKKKNARLIICKYNNKSIAFVADEISKIREISAAEVQQSPSTFNEIPSKYIIGMYRTSDNNLLVILNFGEIFSCEQVSSLAEGDQAG